MLLKSDALPSPMLRQVYVGGVLGRFGALLVTVGSLLAYLGLWVPLFIALGLFFKIFEGLGTNK